MSAAAGTYAARLADVLYEARADLGTADYGDVLRLAAALVAKQVAEELERSHMGWPEGS